jgi:hypothetical protein
MELLLLSYIVAGLLSDKAEHEMNESEAKEKEEKKEKSA